MSKAIKICGITNLVDAQAATAAGATYLGLIFVESSPRKVDHKTAQAIAQALRGKAKLVGVFKDSSSAEIAKTFTEVGLDLVQYHGCESPEQIVRLSFPAIKALTIDQQFNWDNARRYQDSVELLLLDRPKQDSSPGWLDEALSITRTAPADIPPFFFAGGLTPDNVQSVVKILIDTTGGATSKHDLTGVASTRISSFYGVDVASGIEREPGIKDPVKLERFCKLVREDTEKCVH